MSSGSSRRSVSSANRWPAWSRNWSHVEGALEEIALDPSGSLSAERFDELVSDAHAARTRIREAAYQQLHRDPYRADMAAGILARVPAELDALNEEVVVTACIGLGFTIEHPRGRRIFAIELGNNALVDGLPGVAGGSSYVGTFDREEAVERETIDFFASGHPLVEGIFAHFEDSALGRVVRFEVEIGAENMARGSWPSTRTDPCSRSWRSTPLARLGRTGRPQSVSDRSPRACVTDDADEGVDWPALIRRLGHTARRGTSSARARGYRGTRQAIRSLVPSR